MFIAITYNNSLFIKSQMPIALCTMLICLQLSWQLTKIQEKDGESRETGMGNVMKYKSALNVGTEIHSKAFLFSFEK